jgi:hypothetical protein
VAIAELNQALAGFFSLHNLERMEERNIDAYVPDSNMARAVNLGTRLPHLALRIAA